MPTTVSISEAKQRLGEIADRALEGEQIVIIRKSRLLVLKPLEIPEPVPIRSLRAAIYLLPEATFQEARGKVTPPRRTAIARKIAETLRLSMGG